MPLPPGGSFGNMMGIQVARYHHDKSIKEKGHFGRSRLVMFISADVSCMKNVVSIKGCIYKRVYL